MRERYIARTVGGLYGYWGAGRIEDEAIEKMRKSGAKRRDPYRVYKFTSDLPFAPVDREATEQEADCWVGEDGSCNWIRCERTVVIEPSR